MRWCKPTIAVDLDGTLTHEAWADRAKIGAPAPNSQNVLERLVAAGWQIIIYTCRPEVIGVRAWADEHYPGLIAGVNFNPDEAATSRVLIPKPYADIYIDDKAWPLCGKLIDWFEVESSLAGRGAFDPQV